MWRSKCVCAKILDENLDGHAVHFLLETSGRTSLPSAGSRYTPTCAHTHIHTHTHRHIHTQIQPIYICTHSHMCTNILKHSHSIDTCNHTVHVRAHSHIHINANMHSHTLSHTHTHLCTYSVVLVGLVQFEQKIVNSLGESYTFFYFSPYL